MSAKKSEMIRKDIARLMVELQIYQNSDNDSQMDNIQTRIDGLRMQLADVEIDERNQLENYAASL